MRNALPDASYALIRELIYAGNTNHEISSRVSCSWVTVRKERLKLLDAPDPVNRYARRRAEGHVTTRERRSPEGRLALPIASVTASRDQVVTLVRDNWPGLTRYALKLTKDDSWAEELLAKTLTYAFAGAKTFRSGTNGQAWLITIMKNAFFTDLRQRRRFYDRHAAWSYDVENRPGVDDPSAGLLIRDLERALRTLPERTRQIIKLTTLDGLSQEAAANRLNLNVGTLKSKLARARVELKRLLD